MHPVVALVTGHVSDAETGADFHSLDRAQAQHAAEFRVELVENGFSETGGYAGGAHFHDSGS